MAEGTACAMGMCRVPGAEMRPSREQEGARCEMRVKRVAGTRPHRALEARALRSPREMC